MFIYLKSSSLAWSESVHYRLLRLPWDWPCRECSEESATQKFWSTSNVIISPHLLRGDGLNLSSPNHHVKIIGHYHSQGQSLASFPLFFNVAYRLDRFFGRNQTPLLATIGCNLLNLMLAFVFLFRLNLGAQGQRTHKESSKIEKSEAKGIEKRVKSLAISFMSLSHNAVIRCCISHNHKRIHRFRHSFWLNSTAD